MQRASDITPDRRADGSRVFSGAAGLAPGSQLGAFRIESRLGAGDVYRAYDTGLERAVALEVLPDSLTHNSDRRARLETELRALTVLKHPHVGAMYGVEEAGGVAALVSEFVDGQTLADRLAAGRLPAADVIRIARQLAQGLEAVHDRGIVHRDLEPRNIKIDADGNVRIVGFGLARTAARAGETAGRAEYMSPEQVRGEAVDTRTDIWRFGCVVFEMCARRPAFSGSTAGDVANAVIEREPAWERLPVHTPTALVHLLRRCLTKDPKQRLRDIGEARIALDALQDGGMTATADRPHRWRLAFILAASAAAALLAISISQSPPAAPSVSAPPVRFLVPPPKDGAFTRHPTRVFMALSPDGSRLAFVASTESTPLDYAVRSRIWVRALAEIEARPVPGTDGATSLFWSPDGRSIAFFADGKLKRLDLPGGAPVTLCDAPASMMMHGTWGAGGVILIGFVNGSYIYQVPAAGGELRPLLRRDASAHEVGVHWPWFLPDGRRFLYGVRLDNDEGELRLGQIDGGSRTIMPLTSNAQWVDPGFVVFASEGVLMAQRVDLDAARPVGERFVIARSVDYFFTTSRAMFSVSRTGTIAYHAGGEVDDLVWVDRRGNEAGTVGAPAEYEAQSTRLSRDGTMLLTARAKPGMGTYDIWRMDLVRGTETPMTANRGSELTPVWIDHERAMLYTADRAGSVPHLFRRDLASGVEQQVLPPGGHQLVQDVLEEANAAVYTERSGLGVFQMFKLPLTRDAAPEPFLPSRLSTFEMRASPDGRAMAYVADDGGRTGIYVGPLPMSGAPVFVDALWSAPRWSRDGRHLYYIDRDRRMMALTVRTTPSLAAGVPRPLFQLKQPALLLEVAGDGRFLLLIPRVRAAQRPIAVATAFEFPRP